MSFLSSLTPYTDVLRKQLVEEFKASAEFGKLLESKKGARFVEGYEYAR